MGDGREGWTRAELLRNGWAGLTALTLLPVASSCRPDGSASKPDAEPEENYRVGYREAGGFEPGFHVCRGLAVHGDEVLVAGDMAVRRFVGGRAVAETAVSGAAQAVSVAPDGGVYAALDDRVVDLTSGSPVSWEGLGPRARLVELVATATDVFVADAGNRRVVRYGRDGSVKNLVGDRDPAQGRQGLTVPSPYLGLALLPSGELAVCNPGQHRVEVHSLDGALLRTVGQNGQGMADFCGCCNPMALAVLSDGRLVTAEKGIPRVKVVAQDGALETVVAPPTAFNVNTTGLELAVQGDRVLVLDPWEGRVRTFEPV